MFVEAERAQCRQVFDAEDDVAGRLVLADALLERGEPLGELLRLATEGHPAEEEKAAALRPRLLAELLPGAEALALDRGLPFAARFDASRLLQRGEGAAPVWPLRWATLHGEPGNVLPALRLPLFADLERLDLTGSHFATPYSMFVDDPPAPVPRLGRLAHLLVPRAAPPLHWRALVRETFARATRLSVPADVEELGGWLALVPATRRLDLRVTGQRLDDALRREVLGWLGGGEGRELSLGGVRVSPAQLDELLAAVGPALPAAPLSAVADPPASPVATVEIHGPLGADSDLYDATLDGQRGTWVRLAPGSAFSAPATRVQQDLRLLMMAPLHPHVAGGQTARRHAAERWVFLGEDLRLLGRPADLPTALRAAAQLGAALGALGGYVTQHAPGASFPWPLPATDLLVDARGALRVVPPRAGRPMPETGLASVGLPTRSTTWSLALFTAAVLVEWLTGRPLAPVRAVPRRDLGDWGEWERLTRFLEAPRLPAGLPPQVAALVTRAFTDQHAERLTLPAFVSALEALAR